MHRKRGWVTFLIVVALLESVLVSAPAMGAEYNVPPDDYPRRILKGDVLNVRDGGAIESGFGADEGSRLNILGGDVGDSVDAWGTVNIEGGSIGTSFRTAGPTTISGGTIEEGFYASGPIEIKGGSFGDGVLVDSWFDSTSILGGTFGGSFWHNARRMDISGGTFVGEFTVDAPSRVDITGGQFGRFVVYSSAVANISGGSFGLIRAGPLGASVHLRGTAFSLDGLPLPLVPDEPFLITQRNVSLDATLLDGSAIDWYLNSTWDLPGDFIDSLSTLTVTLVIPEPSTSVLMAIGLSGLIGAMGRGKRRK